MVELYNRERTHTGKHCNGKTPLETFRNAKKIALDKMIGDTPPQEQKEPMRGTTQEARSLDHEVGMSTVSNLEAVR